MLNIGVYIAEYFGYPTFFLQGLPEKTIGGINTLIQNIQSNLAGYLAVITGSIGTITLLYNKAKGYIAKADEAKKLITEKSQTAISTAEKIWESKEKALKDEISTLTTKTQTLQNVIDTSPTHQTVTNLQTQFETEKQRWLDEKTILKNQLEEAQMKIGELNYLKKSGAAT